MSSDIRVIILDGPRKKLTVHDKSHVQNIKVICRQDNVFSALLLWIKLDELHSQLQWIDYSSLFCGNR